MQYHNNYTAEAVVGLEEIFYRVSEDVGVVKVCVIVYEPDDDECPISYPFDVLLSTSNDTAGYYIS